jgi:hypothetical protein
MQRIMMNVLYAALLQSMPPEETQAMIEPDTQSVSSDAYLCMVKGHLRAQGGGRGAGEV